MVSLLEIFLADTEMVDLLTFLNIFLGSRDRRFSFSTIQQLCASLPLLQVGYEVLMCDFNVPPMHGQDRVVCITCFLVIYNALMLDFSCLFEGLEILSCALFVYYQYMHLYPIMCT